MSNIVSEAGQDSTLRESAALIGKYRKVFSHWHFGVETARNAVSGIGIHAEKTSEKLIVQGSRSRDL
jgi:hypothetical protein